MEVIEVKTVSQRYAFKKDIGSMFGYKDPYRLLKAFVNYADDNPKAFYPYKPYINNAGIGIMYSIICFAYFLENKDLLEAGTRSIKFEDELPRLKEVY